MKILKEIQQGIRNEIGHNLKIFVVLNILIKIANELEMQGKIISVYE